MRRFLILGLALCLACVGGCRSRQTLGAVYKDRVQLLNDLADVLETIKDEPTLKEAKPKLDELKERALDLEERWNAQGKPSGKEGERLLEEFNAELKTATDRVFAAARKINPALRAQLPIIPLVPTFNIDPLPGAGS